MSKLPHPRFVGFLLVFALTSSLALPVLPPERALIAGFDLAALVFIFSCAPLWGGDTRDGARRRAARDDGGRTLLLLATLAAFATALAATGILISGHSSLGLADLGICVATLILAWIFANLVFAFHYSHLFYDPVAGGDRAGLIFPGTEDPAFADFCYFSFVIGMTCQVSDVNITDRTIRQAATAHGIAAFFFNLGVLALAVNLAASVL